MSALRAWRRPMHSTSSPAASLRLTELRAAGCDMPATISQSRRVSRAGAQRFEPGVDGGEMPLGGGAQRRRRLGLFGGAVVLELQGRRLGVLAGRAQHERAGVVVAR